MDNNYQDNLLLQHIPTYSRKEILEALISEPADRLQVNTLPLQDRIDYVNRLAEELFLPSSYHVNLAQAILGILKQNYLRNNPLHPKTWERIYFQSEEPSPGIMVTGLSGTGKTTIIRKCLKLFPPTIHHKSFPGLNNGLTQITNLSFTVGAMPDVRNFVDQLFKEWAKVINLRDKFLPQYNVTTKQLAARSIPTFITHCRNHFLGLMHIDEIQSFFVHNSIKNQQVSLKNPHQHRLMKERDDLVLKVLLDIYNKAGWGMILSSTPDGFNALNQRIALFGRITSSGLFQMPLLNEAEDHTKHFMKYLLRFQYVATPIPSDEEESVITFIIQSTGGIYRLILMLWKSAHFVAINSNEDNLKLIHFQHAYNMNISVIADFVNSIRFPASNLSSHYLDR